MACHEAKNSSVSVPSQSTPTTSTAPTLPKASTTLFTNAQNALLPCSATDIFIAPVHALTVAPRAVLTLFRGIKRVAKAVVRRRHEPKQSRLTKIMQEARLEMPEEIDEWEEVDEEDVREDMQWDRLRMKWEKERKEKKDRGEDVNEDDEGPTPLVTRRKVRHWDDEYESDGEVIEIS
ncbi:uncharacterized protein CC84DRAFT_1219747 [Paraphaeosphaeria sporulosa]|uniref:Uncharacterized protein n=1 Tax=Paraphaeosphaeria sporulosa TaxID=1460663 RepID=A0A177C7H4_9PLEO|nr:uncharacterized protein CC84DRAFT_1219747 [Paraphaeosphaeria sporulosa]OAG02802.1 hypothetical protein CC84DRAFT_1219747 [Paraphaeosphaeria sporulosa]